MRDAESFSCCKRDRRDQRSAAEQNGQEDSHGVDFFFAAFGFGAGTCDTSTICLAASSFSCSAG